MRDEKEGRKKQARSSKQQSKATQHTQGSTSTLSLVSRPICGRGKTANRPGNEARVHSNLSEPSHYIYLNAKLPVHVLCLLYTDSLYKEHSRENGSSACTTYVVKQFVSPDASQLFQSLQEYQWNDTPEGVGGGGGGGVGG